MELTIDNIKSLVYFKKVRWTLHAINRLIERNILQDDVKSAILNGEIIETYESDYPYPSCLILGISYSGVLLHIVCGINDYELWIITAYYPSKNDWDDNYRTRRKKI